MHFQLFNFTTKCKNTITIKSIDKKKNKTQQIINALEIKEIDDNSRTNMYPCFSNFINWNFRALMPT